VTGPRDLLVGFLVTNGRGSGFWTTRELAIRRSIEICTDKQEDLVGGAVEDRCRRRVMGEDAGRGRHICAVWKPQREVPGRRARSAERAHLRGAPRTTVPWRRALPFARARSTVRRAPCAVRRAPCAVCRAPCAVCRAPCGRALCAVRWVPCSVPYRCAQEHGAQPGAVSEHAAQSVRTCAAHRPPAPCPTVRTSKARSPVHSLRRRGPH